MEWFRHYHGLSSDPKLTAAALTAEVHHCIAVAAWCFVLEHASSNATRGSAAGISPKVMAIGLRIGLAEAECLLKAFAVEGLILDDGSVKAWDKRQKRSDSSAERVRRWREKTATSATVTNGETPEDGNVTLPDEDSDATRERARQSRTEQKETPPTPPESLAGTVPTTVGAASPPELAKAALWREMKSQVGGANPGSLIGKWVKRYGDVEVFAAHFAAMANPPSDYVEWMTKRLQANGKPYVARMPVGGKSYNQLVRESLTDDDDNGLEAVSRLSGEAPILCPGRAYLDA